MGEIGRKLEGRWLGMGWTSGGWKAAGCRAGWRSCLQRWSNDCRHFRWAHGLGGVSGVGVLLEAMLGAGLGGRVVEVVVVEPMMVLLACL